MIDLSKSTGIQACNVSIICTSGPVSETRIGVERRRNVPKQSVVSVAAHFLGRENGCDQASGSQEHEAPVEALQTGYLDFPEEREKELVTDGREKPTKLTWSGRKLWKDENLGPQA